MKKIKTLLLFSLLFITLTTNILNASAFAVGEAFSRSGQRGVNISVYLYSYRYTPTIYLATYRGQTYDIYCMDPGYHEAGWGSYFYISKVFMQGNTTERENREEFGLATIITAEPGDGDFWTTGNSFSFAKGLALRIFWDGHLGRTYSTKKPDAIRSLRKLAQDFAASGVTTSRAISGNGSVIHDAAVLYRKGLAAERSYTADSVSNVKTEVIDIASEPEQEPETPEEGEEEEEEGFIFQSGTEEPKPVEPVTKEIYEKKIIKLELDNFDPTEGEFTFDSYGATNGINSRVVGISTKRSEDFDEYTTPISYGTDVFKTFSDAVVTDENGRKSLTLYVAVEAQDTITIENPGDAEACEDCKEIKGTLKYTYKDPSLLTGAVIQRSNAYGGYQRFLVASKDKRQSSGSVDLVLSPCNKACENGGPDNPPCDPVVCEGDMCYPNHTIPQICQDDAEVDENGLVEYKFIEAYTKDGYTIEKCIDGARKDIQDNPYELVDDDYAEVLTDNPYCTVLCKEDYSIKLPYKQVVEEGRYFKITLSMKGQQDCYSTNIGEGLFEQDVIKKEQEIVDAINTWNIYYELANGNSSDLTNVANGEIGCRTPSCSNSSSTSSTCSKSSSGYSSSITKQEFVFGKAGLTYYTLNGTTGAVSAISVSSDNVLSTISSPSGTLSNDVNRQYGVVNYDPYTDASCSSTEHTCPEPDPDEESDCETTYTCSVNLPEKTCDITSPADDYSKAIDGYKTKLERAKRDVEEKVEELREIIDRFNSCVGDKNYKALSKAYKDNAFWSMIYRYDPEIKYSYDEPDPTDSSRDKWIDQVKDLTCEDNSCDYMFARNEEILAEDCPEDDSANCTEIGADGTFKSVFYDSLHKETEKETDEDTEETPADDAYANTYCIGSINEDYSCNGTTLHTLTNDTAYINKPFFVCDFSGSKFNCQQKNELVTSVNYVHKSALAQGDYDTRLVYYTGHQNGDIKIEYTEEPILNYSQVPGLPVSADTPQGTYLYILNIENVGTYYSTGELGRIYGSNPNSLSTYSRGKQNSTTVSFPITTGIGDEATDVYKEIAINEYACIYIVSQSSCVDPEGNTHTIDECEFGDKDKNWDECQKRICGGDMCTDSSGITHTADECEPGTDWEDCQKTLCPDEDVCTDSSGITHTSDECEPGTEWEDCEKTLCPDDSGRDKCTDSSGIVHTPDECTPGSSWRKCQKELCPDDDGGDKCTDSSGITHTADECEPGVDWYDCEKTLCPDDSGRDKCTDSSGTVHTPKECTPGSSWEKCKERLCPSGGTPGGDNYCVKQAESYYVCSSTVYDKNTCEKVGSRSEALAKAANNYNCCPKCTTICVGKCMYVVSNDSPNDGKLQFEFRTVTPQNMNPNTRRLGYNWDTANASNSLAAQKAANTISEIEARAGAGSNPSINLDDVDEYKLKVVMTPDMVTWIKKYNNEQETSGAYNNDSLTCYNYNLDGYSEDQCKAAGYIWQSDSCIMSNVFCYSNFIDELEENFTDQVDAPHRAEAKNSAYDNFKAYTGFTSGGQTIITNDYWTIYKYDNLDINGDGIPDIGPSWK